MSISSVSSAQVAPKAPIIRTAPEPREPVKVEKAPLPEKSERLIDTRA